jgi:hypothetical protein
MKIEKFPLEVVIRRASVWDDSCPCEEAHKILCTFVDRRNVDDPMKNPYIGSSWYESGSNHRVENGGICRDFPDERWIIVFEDEKEMLNFIVKYSPVIVSMYEYSSIPCPEIKIYDDYVE